MNRDLSVFDGHLADLDSARRLLDKHITTNRHALTGELLGRLIDLSATLEDAIDDVRCHNGACTRLATRHSFDGSLCDECAQSRLLYREAVV